VHEEEKELVVAASASAWEGRRGRAAAVDDGSTQTPPAPPSSTKAVAEGPTADDTAAALPFSFRGFLERQAALEAVRRRRREEVKEFVGWEWVELNNMPG
jgi:hypothetical protein